MRSIASRARLLTGCDGSWPVANFKVKSAARLRRGRIDTSGMAAPAASKARRLKPVLFALVISFSLFLFDVLNLAALEPTFYTGADGFRRDAVAVVQCRQRPRG